MRLSHDLKWEKKPPKVKRSIEIAVQINLGRPKLVFDSAHVKYAV